jgi:trk system potassium uptake protein TrkA
MKIIILGAGQVGGTLAEHLANEQNDITVVDTDGEKLRALQDRLDIGTVTGGASYPNILHKAGAEDADMLIAVTNSDEINMMACQVAHTLFNTPTKISRVRSPNYLSHQKQLFTRENIPVDVIIGPEQLVTQNIQRLIANPGALQVLDFAEGDPKYTAPDSQPGGPASTRFRRGPGTVGGGEGLPRRSDSRPGVAGNPQAHAQGGHTGRRYFPARQAYRARGQYCR